MQAHRCSVGKHMASPVPNSPEQLRYLRPLRTPDGHGPRERRARYIPNERYDEGAAAHDEAALDQYQRHLDRCDDKLAHNQSALYHHDLHQQHQQETQPNPKRQRQEGWNEQTEAEDGEAIALGKHDTTVEKQNMVVAESQLLAVLSDRTDEAMSGTETQSLSNDDAESDTETQSLSSVDVSPAAIDSACAAKLHPLSSACLQLPVEDGSGCQVSLNRTIDCSDETDGRSFASLVLAGQRLQPEDCVFLTTMGCNTKWVLDRLKPGDGVTGARVTIVAHSDACWTTETKHHTKDIPGFDNCRIVFPYMPRCSQRIGESGLGIQHGKLVLVFRETHVRVLVSSANLTPGNWTQHTNVAWWQDFPMREAVCAPTKAVDAAC